MNVSRDAIAIGIRLIASVKGIKLEQPHLMIDLLGLAQLEPFSDDEKFISVVQTIQKALIQISEGTEQSDDLKGNYSELKSLHTRSEYPTDYPRDDLRIVYQKPKKSDGEIIIFGFGHRYLPDDFYKRLKQRVEHNFK